MASQSSANQALFLSLLGLVLLLAMAPGAQAHCPSNATCIHDGYINQTDGYRPYRGKLWGEEFVQGAQCYVACSKFGYKYFSLLAGICSCYDVCTTHKHGAGFSGVTYACISSAATFKATTACTAPVTGTCDVLPDAPAVCAQRKSTCQAVDNSTRSCCCSASSPNPVLYRGTFRGCAP